MLLAQVKTCEEFERSNGRFEYIYGIDILFSAQDSVIEYLIDQKVAVEVSFFFNLNLNKKQFIGILLHYL